MAKQTDLRRLARKLASDVNEHLLRLGNVLVAISESKLYQAWAFSTWDDYLKEEIGLSQAQAWHLMTMSRWATTMKLSVKQRERFGRLGKYKAVLVTKLCTNKKKIGFYLDMAENHTYRHLQAEYYGRNASDIKSSWGLWVSGVERTFIDEAITLASETSEETNRGALLATICQDYLQRWKKSRKGKAAMN